MSLYLIDGHALIFKMYYAFLGRPMVNSKGADTSIIFGVTKYLLELMSKEQPTHIAVAFDPPGGTFRNEMYPEYKANRAETPQLVIDALEPMMEILKALEIPVLMRKGFEADDVIGSLAKRCVKEGVDVYMVTPDKDYGQLIAPGIYQYKPGKGGGESEIYDSKAVCEKYGIDRPEQVIDLLALCGDTADNVPGVQGVGPKGASKLLGKYGTLENIYEHLSELTEKQRAMFEAAKDHIVLSKELVTIKTDMDLSEYKLENMRLSQTLGPEIYRLIDFYEMRSLRKTVDALWSVQSSGAQENRGAEISCKEVTVDKIRALVSAEKRFAFVLDGDYAVLACGEAYCRAEVESFKPLFEDEDIVKIGHSLKKRMHELDVFGIELRGQLLDVELLHYLQNPEYSHSLSVVVKDYLGIELEESAAPAQTLSLFDEVPEDVQSHDKEAVALYKAAPLAYQRLGEMQSVYDKIEEPLLKVLYRMEKTGVLIDMSTIRDFADSLRTQMASCEAEVRRVAGNPSLNVASPKQVGELLFEQLKLDPKAKKTSRGAWPTDEETLSALADRNPVIDTILDYRGTRKLLSTYIEPLPGFISEHDGRVHTTFNQALTSTGRLSSSNPNLQNIPIRTDQGREIRRAFVAPESSVIMSADYSQIELRVMAHFCGDEHMQQAYLQGLDVHKAMAAKIFSKPLEDVTPDDRRMAKTANFGIMYGISAFGLAQRLNISRSEAAKLIEDYFNSFPSIRTFIDKTLAKGRDDGYVETLFGRRRYVRDLTSSNGNLRAVAERNAVNAPIQGTAADIIKLAMTEVDSQLRKRNLQSRMVLQIHDELLLEVKENEIEEVKKLLVETMENVVKLSVPLTVECNYGKNWIEAH